MLGEQTDHLPDLGVLLGRTRRVTERVRGAEPDRRDLLPRGRDCPHELRVLAQRRGGFQKVPAEEQRRPRGGADLDGITSRVSHGSPLG